MSTWTREIGRSERSARFRKASAYYFGEQYADLAPWHESRDKKLRERQPAVIVRMVKSAVDTVNSYLFGSGRAPQFRVTSLLDEDGYVVPEAELTDEDRQELREVNQELQRIRAATQLDAKLSEVGRCGLLHGSVALAGHQLETGRTWSEVVQVADAFPTFGSDDRALADELRLREDDLLKLEEYWIRTRSNLDGEVTTVNRRTWEPTRTVEYEPIELDGDGEDVDLEALEWTEDDDRTVTHDLGFVPIVWIQNIRIAGEVDGAPLVSDPEFGFEDEISYTLSQTGAAVRYNGDPKVVFRNVANISSKAGASDHKIKANEGRSISVESYGVGGMPPAEVAFLEMSGTGQAVAFEYVDVLRQMFQQVTRVIEHDPEKAVGALSGTAIERLMMPLVSLVGSLRESYGTALARWFELMLRVSDESRFDGYQVQAIWPSVIEPSPADLQLIATPVAALYLQGLITLRTAVEVLSPLFDIDDLEAYLEQLRTEAGSEGTTTAQASAQAQLDDPGLF